MSTGNGTPSAQANRLSDDDRNRLIGVVQRRLGVRGSGADLVAAYLAAVEQHAFARTVDAGPVPTSLTVERSAVLIEISRKLMRVIEDFEIQALFRVTLPQARAMRTTLVATYTDDVDDLTLEWALAGAKTCGRQKIGKDGGTKVQFTSEERRDTFVEQLARAGTPAEAVASEKVNEWLAVVGDAFPTSQLPKA